MTGAAFEYKMLRKYLKLTDCPEGGLEARVSAAMREELTPRQRQMAELYYIRQMTMQDIAGVLGVNVSTVSRTLKRGRERMRRCLRFGGELLLESVRDRL